MYSTDNEFNSDELSKDLERLSIFMDGLKELTEQIQMQRKALEVLNRSRKDEDSNNPSFSDTINTSFE